MTAIMIRIFIAIVLLYPLGFAIVELTQLPTFWLFFPSALICIFVYVLLIIGICSLKS